MASPSGWWLERIAADGSPLAVPVDPLPFTMGRELDNALVLTAPGVSRHHARLELRGEALVLADLGSTNGTWVNRMRLEAPQAVAEHDIVHIGLHAEFRVRRGVAETRTTEAPPAGERTVITRAGTPLSEHFVAQEAQFLALLSGEGLSAAVQPIVTSDGSLYAYELLGRGTHPGLSSSPAHLFRLAERLHRAAALSEAFRRHGVRAVAGRLGNAALFANAHPAEIFEPGFVDSIAALVREQPGLDLVVEIHETAVVELARMRELAARLADVGVRFAYDDFGAGQARLVELGEVPPHVVKFDMSLVDGLHAASPRKQRLVADLVRLVNDLGSIALAEGLEAEADAAVCREMGFRLLQGFLVGRPVPVESLGDSVA
jgi:EAL domain-containing protein (putative c-di-GMP-specific phosphodiesterase class I)